MPACHIMPAETIPYNDQLLPLIELETSGYGSRPFIRDRINSGELPAVKVGKSFKVRRGDLHLLASPVGAARQESAPTLCDLLTSLVTSYPRLDNESKKQLSQILAAVA